MRCGVILGLVLVAAVASAGCIFVEEECPDDGEYPDYEDEYYGVSGSGDYEHHSSPYDGGDDGDPGSDCPRKHPLDEDY